MAINTPQIDIAEVLLISITAIISVAFFTLAERNAIAMNHNRNGPNKASVNGLTQPLADAINLITKEWNNLNTSNKLTFIISPGIGLTAYLILWSTLPSSSSTTNMSLATLFMVAVISTTIIFSMTTGWASNSKYSILGSYRATAQAISYEVSIAIFILSAVTMVNTLNTANLNETKITASIILLPVLSIWIITVLAETGRTPFDFIESESELVSGFNTEFYGALFSIFFIAEYLALIFIAALSALLFASSNTLMAYSEATVLLLTLTVIRITLPRTRYDNLMTMAWVTVIPISILALTTVLVVSEQGKSWNLSENVNKITIPIMSATTSALSFCASKNHVLPMLLSIELLTLSLIAIASMAESSKAVLTLSMIIVMVIEGITGLTILINSANSKGNDLVFSTVI